MSRAFCVALKLLAALAVGNGRSDLIIDEKSSPTGPNATSGQPGKNATELVPRTIAGQKVEYVKFDDTVDPKLGADLLTLCNSNAWCGSRN